MPNNELILLDQLLDQRQALRDAPLPADVAFEQLASEMVLRDHDLSEDEVEAGIVGGGNDGGLDGIYVLVGGQLIPEDSDLFGANASLATFPRHISIDLHFVQAKRSPSFSETAFDRAHSSLRRLLDLEFREEDLAQLYSTSVVDRVGIFRRAWRFLAVKHPKISVSFHYVTRGDTSNVDPKVEVKAADLEGLLADLVPGATVDVSLVGAAELWDIAERTPTYTVALEFLEQITAEDSYVVLVRLDEYYKFLTDGNGHLRRHLFEWNVRDYQGAVAVNKEIAASLEDPEAPRFWWMNNGVTIICSNASSAGRRYTLDDVRIVNGLQTSYAIFDAFRTLEDVSHLVDKALLVRILVTEDEEVRDRVIRATNRQTTVSDASLRAMDEIQRKIETYFKSHEWYYDRRKNFYKNQGVARDRIVSISSLAQAVLATGFGEPDNARARPSSLLKKDLDYHRIFSSDIGLGFFLWAARTLARIHTFLLGKDLTPAERTNYRYHLATIVAWRLAGAIVQSPHQLTQVVADDASVDDAFLESCLSDLHGYFTEELEVAGAGQDKIAKNRAFVDRIKAHEAVRFLAAHGEVAGITPVRE